MEDSEPTLPRSYPPTTEENPSAPEPITPQEFTNFSTGRTTIDATETASAQLEAEPLSKIRGKATKNMKVKSSMNFETTQPPETIEANTQLSSEIQHDDAQGNRCIS